MTADRIRFDRNRCFASWPNGSAESPPTPVDLHRPFRFCGLRKSKNFNEENFGHQEFLSRRGPRGTTAGTPKSDGRSKRHRFNSCLARRRGVRRGERMDRSAQVSRLRVISPEASDVDVRSSRASTSRCKQFRRDRSGCPWRLGGFDLFR